MRLHPFTLMIFACCVAAAAPSSQPSPQSSRIDSDVLCELSGLVASRRYPGILWTHNDSGHPAELFAITREGRVVARFPVRASNRDWEDIAIDDDGHLYIGEIGNNGGRQRQVAVYRVAEPDPNIAAPDPPGRREPLMVTATWQLRFPGDVAPFDCESLFVWKDVGYVISKRMDLGPAGLWRFSLDPQPKGWGLLEKVCDLPVNAPVGGADVSPDGKWLALVTPLGPGLLRIDTDPARAADAEPKFVSHFDLLAEGVCFTPEGVVTVAETGEITLFPTALFDSDE